MLVDDAFSTVLLKSWYLKMNSFAKMSLLTQLSFVGDLCYVCLCNLLWIFADRALKSPFW